jgi:transketolase
MIELRDAFFYSVLEKAKNDKNVILLTADAGAFALADFQKEVPNQFFNVGIAEQNMVSVAAGLASKGKQVYCYSIASFLILRAFEQIKIDVCNMNSNVILAGIGAGVDYSYDGSTHHCQNDIGVLNTLPNMKIYVPFDEETVKWSVEESGPLYIRLPKGNVENLPKEKIASGMYLIREGKSYILTYGMVTHKLLKMLDELKAKNVGLIAITKLKPMFGPSFMHTDKLMIVEQHSLNGGLLSLVGSHRLLIELAGRYNGYNDVFVDVGGSADYVEREAGIYYKQVAKQIMELNNEH